MNEYLTFFLFIYLFLERYIVYRRHHILVSISEICLKQVMDYILHIYFTVFLYQHLSRSK